MTEPELEVEQKYLVNDTAPFWDMVHHTSQLKKVESYLVGGCVTKARVCRHFDTFEGDLFQRGDLPHPIEVYVRGESSTPFVDVYSSNQNPRELNPQERGMGELERLGISVSLRERGNLSDCIFTVKIPTGKPNERGEYSCRISGAKFYELDPNSFKNWDPLSKVSLLGRGNPLQEVVRLYIQTHRFDLYKTRRIKGREVVQVALDLVVAQQETLNKQALFYELEIEQLEAGREDDLTCVNEHFVDRFGRYLTKSPVPKWIKALRLIRDELAVKRR